MRRIAAFVACMAIELCCFPLPGAAQTAMLHGRVTAEGRGVGGVQVTDGYTIVQTDAKGDYRLTAASDAAFVYLTLPDGYEIPAEKGTAKIYRRLETGKVRYDFTLTPSKTDLTRHRLIVWADPQVYRETELDSVRRAAADVRRTAADGIPTFGVMCGDIIGDITHTPSLFAPVRDATAESGMPFFYVVGNHDLEVDTAVNDDNSRRSFEALFGPRYYAFNRGRIHYVVLDDSFILARGVTRYVGYIDRQQMGWLAKDLAYVPAGSTVVVCLHIPTWSRAARSGEWGKEEWNKVVNNREVLYTLLKPYNAHIMSAHEHYNENYVLSPHLFEHVHLPLSTLFWQTPWSMDGIPAGYAVYDIDGDSVSWYLKTVDHDRSRQFNACGVGADRHKPEAVTVNVWNYDPAWKVEWYENGVYRGEMTRYTGYDEAEYDYVVRNHEHFDFPYLGTATTEHMFYAVPSNPSDTVRVEVRDRFGRVSAWESVTGYEKWWLMIGDW